MAAAVLDGFGSMPVFQAVPPSKWPGGRQFFRPLDPFIQALHKEMVEAEPIMVFEARDYTLVARLKCRVV